MEKNTKILIGLAAIGVVAYLLLKPKKAVTKSNIPPFNDFPDRSKLPINLNNLMNGVSPDLSKYNQDLDLSSLTQDTTSPNINKLIDREGNTIFREDDNGFSGYTKIINLSQGGDIIIDYNLNGKFIKSSYDNGIRY